MINYYYLFIVSFQQVQFKVPAYNFTTEELDKHKLKMYSTDVHSASFSVPRFVRMALQHLNC